MGNELAIPNTPALEGDLVEVEVPNVRDLDLFGALLADARTEWTRRARVQDLSDLAKFLHLESADQACAAAIAGGAPRANAICAAYSAYMQDRGLGASTINRRLSSIRRLVKLARRYELVSWTLEVDALRVEGYRDTTGPGLDGWHRMLETATRLASRTARGKRDLALIRVLHDLGLRRSEARGLRLADLELDAGRLHVLGKGRTQRIPRTLNKPTLLALSRWVDVRGTEPGPLFTRMDKARPKGQELHSLNGESVRRIVNGLGRRAGLSRVVRPHGLRHQAITRILELTGGNLTAAQAFGRHADPKTTQKYNDNRTDVAGEMTRILGED